MAVASDLPSLEQLPQVAKRKNSVLYRRQRQASDDADLQPGPDHRHRRRRSRAYAKYAVIAIEDQRFYENSGVDLRGIGRAFVQDVVQGRQAQGGSTIAQQFVKNALQAQAKRTVFEKLREAAMAYHLTRKWSKDADPHRVPQHDLLRQRRLRHRGRGAHLLRRRPRPRGLRHAEPPDVRRAAHARRGRAAGRRSSRRPSGYDPVAHPVAAMRAAQPRAEEDARPERASRAPQYQDAIQRAARRPTSRRRTSSSPRAPSTSCRGCASRWSTRSAPQRAFEGDLDVKTTLDLDLQNAAQNAVNNYLS